MQLAEMLINRGAAIVRKIEFKKGLNLIIDKPTEKIDHSGNNLGKTTVLRLIDFCLGADGAVFGKTLNLRKALIKKSMTFSMEILLSQWS